MPIPSFDSILNILPPHLGDPTNPEGMSPHKCEIDEVINFFATNQQRVDILEGLLKFRQELHQLGIKGFQWLDGSFVENKEAQSYWPPAQRSPEDIDIVTFISRPSEPEELKKLLTKHGKEELLNPDFTKAAYMVESFIVPLGSDPASLVNNTRYWFGLFSHQRRTQAWKGMLQVPLNDLAVDTKAHEILGEKQ